VLKRISVIAIAAMAVLAVSGFAADAASRYLITSARQIKPSVLKQLRSQGPAGAAGAPGAAGPAGVFSTANVTQVTGAVASMCTWGSGTCDVGSSVANCPAGSAVLGGGYDGGSDPPIDASVGYDKPIGTSAWEVIMTNDDTYGAATFNAVATCATSSGAAIASVRAHRAGLTAGQRAELAADLATARRRAHTRR